MQIPKSDFEKNNETGCCCKFDPEPWDQKEFTFNNKLFVKVKTINFFHIPLNMGGVMKKIMKKAENDFDEEFVMLSYDPSMWIGEHYLAVKKDIPGEEMVRLSGTYLTKVFEGPYKDAGKWVKQMQKYMEDKGKKIEKLYFYYTTCPKCAKHYGKNYTVAFAQI